MIVIFTKSGGSVGTYPVFPVDAVGKEILGFTDDSADINCFLTAIDHKTQVTVYKNDDGKIWNPQAESVDGASFSLVAGEIKHLVAQSEHAFKGVLFKADRPFYMLCGESLEDSRRSYYQLPGRESLGREFITPAFNPVIVNRPFDAKLRIQADSDNTLVYINGDFDAIHPIYKRGK